MAYSAVKSLNKGAVPLIALALAHVIIGLLKSQGIEADETMVVSIVMGGYAGMTSLINFFKNYRKP